LLSTKLNATAANQNIATTVIYAPVSDLMTGFTYSNTLKTIAISAHTVIVTICSRFRLNSIVLLQDRHFIFG
jgi:hypothetical protein